MINSAAVRLTLPWPDPVLNPNNRKHWSVKKDAKRAARELSFAAAYNLGLKLDPEKHYQFELIFCPPDPRKRDLDNLLAAMKNQLDGMCKAFGIDDRMIRPVPDWGPVAEKGQVEITITERETLKDPQNA